MSDAEKADVKAFGSDCTRHRNMIVDHYRSGNSKVRELSLFHKLPRVSKEVTARLTKYTDMGVQVIVNDVFPGVIPHSEMFFYRREHGDVPIGGLLSPCYVKYHRIDGKIEIACKPLTRVANIVKVRDRLLGVLRSKESIPFGDKSDPLEIYQEFKISKGIFKKACGMLQKQGYAYVSDNMTQYMDPTKLPEKINLEDQEADSFSPWHGVPLNILEVEDRSDEEQDASTRKTSLSNPDHVLKNSNLRRMGYHGKDAFVRKGDLVDVDLSSLD